MSASLNMQAPLFMAFLANASNVRIARPWPNDRPEARIVRFTKGGEEYAAAYDMGTQRACVMMLADLRRESAASS